MMISLMYKQIIDFLMYERILMKELTIGDIINYQIEKKSIEPEKLTEGLCSASSFKRLINGDTKQSFFLVERILQRLGISVNKVTLLHNESDDSLLVMREMISKLLVEKAYTKAEFILSEYEATADSNSPLQLQYVLEAKGVIMSDGYGRIIGDSNGKTTLTIVRTNAYESQRSNFYLRQYGKR